MSKLLKIFTELYDRKNILRLLIIQQLVLRYRRTMLGYIWTLINPLLNMAVIAFIFSSIFKMELRGYILYLFSGLIPWTCFNLIVTQSSRSFIANEGLIKKIYIPKIIFPLSQSLAVLADCFFAFLALFLIILLVDPNLTTAILFIPISYLLLFIFSFGIALIVSILTVFFRDLEHVIVVIMQILYFLTPVMYKTDSLSPDAHFFMMFNPLVPFVELFRAPLYYHQLPDVHLIILSTLISIVVFVIGLYVFLINHKKIIFRL